VKPAKVSAKFVAGFVPFLGAAVSVTISRHILKQLIASAKFYENKIKDASTPESPLASRLALGPGPGG
jgi:hypothetical protein